MNCVIFSVFLTTLHTAEAKLKIAAVLFLNSSGRFSFFLLAYKRFCCFLPSIQTKIIFTNTLHLLLIVNKSRPGLLAYNDERHCSADVANINMLVDFFSSSVIVPPALLIFPGIRKFLSFYARELGAPLLAAKKIKLSVQNILTFCGITWTWLRFSHYLPLQKRLNPFKENHHASPFSMAGYCFILLTFLSNKAIPQLKATTQPARTKQTSGASE